MTICILGRQPELGLAELEALYGPDLVTPLGRNAALISANVSIDRLGGTVKTATLVHTVATTTPKKIFQTLAKLSSQIATHMPAEGKIKLGLSTYGLDLTPYQIGGEALRLKKILRGAGRSVRVVPNDTTALSSAQTYHNQLASNLGIEFVIVTHNNSSYIGRVNGVQNIDNYRIRDRERPKRDAFVGMLPPKLAQIMINLAVGTHGTQPPMINGVRDEDISPPPLIFDPFCGTGVVLQEALLMGYDVYGTDLSPKMIEYTKANLGWLEERRTKEEGTVVALKVADATSYTWDFSTLNPQPSTCCIATETYLGQPLGGQSPSPEKLSEIVYKTNGTVRDFLKNIIHQLPASTSLCLAVPAWHVNGTLTRLPVINDLRSIELTQRRFAHAASPLIYRRDGQVTGRELLVLTKNQP